MEHFGLMRLKSGFAHDSTQALIGYNMSNSLEIRLHSPKVPDRGDDTGDPYVEFYFNPACNHKVCDSIALIGSFLICSCGQVL